MSIQIRLGHGPSAAQLAAELAQLDGISITVELPPELKAGDLCAVLAKHNRAILAVPAAGPRPPRNDSPTARWPHVDTAH